MNRNVGYFVLLSFIGGICVVIIGWMGSFQAEAVDSWGKLLVGAPFILSCIIGISLAFRPSWIGRMFKSNKNLKGEERKVLRRVRGHHPDCDRFEGHVVRIDDKTVCTGCLGLAVGAVISIILMIAYMIIPLEFFSPSLYLLLTVGLAMVALSLFEAAFTRNRFIHILLNILLILGFFLTVMSVFQLSGKPIYSWVVIIISFLWLETRIQIANWRHDRICSSCSEDCKIFDSTNA
ncbi:MAG: hypothetical protein GKC03_09370 [Methanomassiliicoccales archaeon]|nr:hypothetical protein [Methanomassiliicoccales archaeon]NYT16212.1 hypothetical protein [Methanomassiliicoccales archaeon]